MMKIRCSFGCILLVLGILGGCGSADKPAPICALISEHPEPNYELNKPVPGVAYISVNPNTPTGNGGAWGPKGENQVVLAFTLFSKDGEHCQAPNVTRLIMEIAVNTKHFAASRNFTLFGKLDGHLTPMATGRVTNDGKLIMNFSGQAGQLEKGARRYFELRLDTSDAYPGSTLAITSGIVEYEVQGQKLRSYQPPYTPPPLEY